MSVGGFLKKNAKNIESFMQEDDSFKHYVPFLNRFTALKHLFVNDGQPERIEELA